MLLIRLLPASADKDEDEFEDGDGKEDVINAPNLFISDLARFV